MFEAFLRNLILRNVQVKGPVGQDTIEVRPPDGRAWIIMDGWGYHNDTVAARDCHWRYHDPKLTFGKAEVSLAAGQKYYLVQGPIDMASAKFLVFDHDHYPSFKVTSIDPAKLVTVQFYVMEFTP